MPPLGSGYVEGVADDYASHKHPAVKAWLAARHR